MGFLPRAVEVKDRNRGRPPVNNCLIWVFLYYRPSLTSDKNVVLTLRLAGGSCKNVGMLFTDVQLE